MVDLEISRSYDGGPEPEDPQSSFRAKGADPDRVGTLRAYIGMVL